MDGFGGAQALVGDEFPLDALGLGAFQVQVAEPAQRLGAQRRIAGVQIEKALVAVHGLGRIDVLRRIGVDVDRLTVEILDRRCGFFAAAAGTGRSGQQRQAGPAM